MNQTGTGIECDVVTKHQRHLPIVEGMLKHQAFEFLTRGYEENVESVLNEALFTVEYDELVIVKDIEVYVGVE